MHSRSSSRPIHPDQNYDLTSNKKVGMFAMVRKYHLSSCVWTAPAVSLARGLSSRRSPCCSVGVWHGCTPRHGGRRDRQIALNQSTLITSRGPLAPATCRSLAADFFPSSAIGDMEVANLKFFNRADTTPNFWPFVSYVTREARSRSLFLLYRRRTPASRG